MAKQLSQLPIINLNQLPRHNILVLFLSIQVHRTFFSFISLSMQSLLQLLQEFHDKFKLKSTRSYKRFRIPHVDEIKVKTFGIQNNRE